MKWILPEKEEGDVFANILRKRNIQDIDKFLNPSFSQIHDAHLLYGADIAAKEILNAIKEKKKIFIHGDFDVDGITATSIMWAYLYRQLGADVIPYIPNRFDEGYGLSDDSIQAIINQGGNLIITVDCGVKDIALVEKYKDKIDFIITDHHNVLSKEELKKQLAVAEEIDVFKYKAINDYAVSYSALAVVHPELNDYPFKNICGAAVAWKVCKAVNDASEIKFDMNQYLDLVALGTVCDVMPLIDENRAIVKLGLEQMRNTQNVGIKKLFEVAGSSYKDADTYHLGYILGPRLNAAGRIDSAIDAVRLLSTNFENHAVNYASKLHTLNIQRQQITKELVDKASLQAQEQDNNKLIFVHGEGWPEGIVGLVAGKLNQKYNRPSLVASVNSNIVKGSARSPEYFNIAESLKALDRFLIKHGGHAGAAGFTLDLSNLESFKDALLEYAENQISDENMEKLLNIELSTPLKEASFELVENINDLSPFGVGNKQPIIAFTNLVIISLGLVGNEKKHVKMILTDKSLTLEAIGFNMSDKISDIAVGSKVDVAGYLEIDKWNGNSKLKLNLVDIKN